MNGLATLKARLLFMLMRRDMLGFLDAAASASGHSLPLPLVARTLHVVLSPEMTEAVLVRAAGDFPKAPGKFGDLDRLTVGDGLFRRLLLFPFDDQFWVRERALVNSIFRRELMTTYAAEIGRQVAGFVERRRDGTDDFDALLAMSRLIFAGLSNNLLHYDGADEADAIFEAFDVLSAFATQRSLSPVNLPAALPTPGLRRVRRAGARIADFLDRAAAPNGRDPPPLLTDETGGRRILDDDWRYQIASLLIAGYETTAVGLAWTLRLLADHPQVQLALAEEVDQVCGDSPPDMAQAAQLKRVAQVANEGLRLFPPLWILGLRQAARDLTLCGTAIRRGDLVLVSPWISHHDGAFFPDPQRFDPDRWEGRQSGLARYAFIPFGVGANACIGRVYAQMAMQITLAGIVQAFHVERAADAGFDGAVPQITLRPTRPFLKLRPRRRGERVQH